MNTMIRCSEEQLSREIEGLEHRLAELEAPGDLASRRAASFLRQVLKSKLEKRATLRHLKAHPAPMSWVRPVAATPGAGRPM